MDFPRLPPEFTRRHLAISLLLFVVVYTFAATAPPGAAGFADPSDYDFDFGEERAALWVPGRVPTTTPAPPIWVGSPVATTWGNAGRPGSTPAGGHHLLGKTTPSNEWAVDLPVGAGAAVLLYVAAADPANDAAITTTITQINDDDACIKGGGGDFVTVGIFFRTALVGHVTYAHLDRDPSLTVGASVPRWGANLGKVANLRGRATGGSSCWTGPHVHLEMRAQSQAACWNRGHSVGRKVRQSDSLGFVSGALGAAVAPCP
ncbi:hypothetical protein [Rhizocola hellebori]|uniref:hypothetical protein n=1 Tax=Rhizocola hellebori TaxID=1392758 RepID=UPI0019403DE0|nr:hypothetical protein [Rhizocola hellebori]